jgi:hypothetical protein
MIRMAVTHLFLLAIASTGWAAPGFAKDHDGESLPKLIFEPITAHNLLAPVDTLTTNSSRLHILNVEPSGLVEPPPYRLERDGDLVTGNRARLSVAVGETRLFAVSGKLARRERPGPPDPVDVGRTSALGPRRLESGRLYGGGIERTFGPVDLSAAYQYSRINGADLDPTSDESAMQIDDKSTSHSFMLRARMRF